jgi:Ig domain of plant-specific actin-binding protein
MSRLTSHRIPFNLRVRTLVVIALTALVVVGVATAASSRVTAAPSNNSAPSISGSAAVGSALTANPGTWNGSTPLAFQYQWETCNSTGGSCHDIAGATTSTYTPASSDEGDALRVVVIASNSDGSSTATSSPTAAIAAAKGPVNTAAPTITGTAAVGSTLTATAGTWTGNGTITYTYAWQICGNDGNSCHAISGATSETYKPVTSDQGNTVRVAVTATDSTKASTSVTSAASAVIAAGSGTTPVNCPSGASKTPVTVASVSLPNQLLIRSATSTTGAILGSMQSVAIKVHVVDTCGSPVSGVQVYVTAVPYGQLSVPPLGTTDANGDTTINFNRGAGFPVSQKQQLMAFFVRATKPGDSILGGVSSRRLLGVKVKLHG